ncbi:hypothetical protein SAMN05216529_102468 [Faecalicatena contorta]|uniref:Uncharacterized protein n=1 Tax=Faecalicatena contorta TaxID=39482 RepID=A0A316A4I1_9FIRM|nr:hypothetical protein A8805_102468 [Faecalicatena contorta]SUQ13250.1 hypothetical protein SAMN05216529_102468 [Faecalicatena contorta]
MPLDRIVLWSVETSGISQDVCGALKNIKFTNLMK